METTSSSLSLLYECGSNSVKCYLEGLTPGVIELLVGGLGVAGFFVAAALPGE